MRRGLRPGVLASGVVSVLSFASPASLLAQDVAQPERETRLSSGQMLDLSDAALARGQVALAIEILRTLQSDQTPQVRNEARFRLGMLYASQERYDDAALLFRQILDEQPDAQRVRLELARVLDRLGDESGARRALREAQAGGLPPDVARMVDRYSAALRSRKPFGASVEFALAPDTNINRATRSNNLSTVIGDLALDEDARKQSGLGATLRTQAYFRRDAGRDLTLIARSGASADIYRDSEFNDISLGVAAGPELRSGRDRISAEVGMTWRWFGMEPYSATPSIGMNYFHPLDKQSQVRLIATAGLVDNKRNDLLDGQSNSLSLSYERALSERDGLAMTLAADRQDLRDPGNSTLRGQVGAVYYRETGGATLTVSASYGRTEADERLVLFPERRIEDLFRVSIGATLRRLSIGSFAPVIRIVAERNRSNIELDDYRRLRAEFGIARAF